MTACDAPQKGRIKRGLPGGRFFRSITICHRKSPATQQPIPQESPVPSYNTSQFKKGLKVQIDGDPYLMVACEFVKPGKGQALYKCKLKNLVRQTMLDRTYKSGDSLDAADIEEIDAQYLYRQGDQFVFMDNESFEQYELTKEQVDETWKWIKEGTVCKMMLFNNNPISV